ncbi:SPOR domain-containing protein [Thalassomonas sp. M1454]|uniref:SPOR domain-containing protein n=1 Tax=Thalassomonas sp. M1454 TaxID=2594477 RepID=UPI0011815163|nr:SPOR domain-containing protein [Thalassomonas sp. M1454]TRX57274.1 dedD protein [Thalassomonas sp. M1454]
MSTPFQNRLVGTIIVAAAAVIFLPDVFDGEKQAYQAQFESIPATPKSVPIATKQDFPEQKIADLTAKQPLSKDTAADQQLLQTEKELPDELAVPRSNSSMITAAAQESKPKAKVVKSTPIKAVAKTVDKSKAYVIQLGSFKHKKNVEQLIIKLKKSGYTVYSKPIKTAAGELTKVFIGPEISKASLEAKLPKLKSLTGVQGRVAVYQPVD